MAVLPLCGGLPRRDTFLLAPQGSRPTNIIMLACGGKQKNVFRHMQPQSVTSQVVEWCVFEIPQGVDVVGIYQPHLNIKINLW